MSDKSDEDARVGSVQVTFATRVIGKGEEICHIYQGHFGDTELTARRAILRDMFREFDSIGGALSDNRQIKRVCSGLRDLPHFFAKMALRQMRGGKMGGGANFKEVHFFRGHCSRGTFTARGLNF